jgi:hypothetical protein
MRFVVRQLLWRVWIQLGLSVEFGLGFIGRAPHREISPGPPLIIGCVCVFSFFSLDKHMQNEKELIRLRRFMPAARTTRARSAQFRLRRELPCTRVVQILPAAQTTRIRH